MGHRKVIVGSRCYYRDFPENLLRTFQVILLKANPNPPKSPELALKSINVDKIIENFNKHRCGFFSPEAKSDKTGQDMEHLDFKIVVEPKDSQSFTVILVASSRQEKSAWTSDISQARQARLQSAARTLAASLRAPQLANVPLLLNPSHSASTTSAATG